MFQTIFKLFYLRNIMEKMKEKIFNFTDMILMLATIFDSRINA